MTKFFTQLLLSVIVGFGVAVGFNSEAKDKLHATWHAAKTFVHEMADAAFETASEVEINTAALIGAEAETKVELEAEIESEVEAETSTDTEAQAEFEAEAESETEVEIETENAELELESELESDLGLDLGLDK